VRSHWLKTSPASAGGVYRVAIRGEAPGVNYCSCPDYAVNTLVTRNSELRTNRKASHREGRRLMTSAHSDALVLFGITGDLAHKMIFPARSLAIPPALFATVIREIGGAFWPSMPDACTIFTMASAEGIVYHTADRRVAMLARMFQRRMRG